MQFASFGQGVEFAELDFEQAVIKAKTENKHLFIDFYTNWCAPCKLMDRDVFPLEEVGDYFNSKFISIKINGEIGEGIDLAKKYAIKAYPTFVILDGNQEVVHVFAGGILDGQKFIDKVDVSFNPEKAYGALKSRYETGERGLQLESAYLQALINTHTVRPDSLVDVFYNKLSKEEKISKEALFVFEMLAPFGSDRVKFLETNREEFRKVIGTPKIDSILVSKYESFYTNIVRGYAQNTSLEQIKEVQQHINSLGITHLKALPVLESGARLQLTKKGKDAFLAELENTVPNLTPNEKDIMLYAVIPGLKNLFTDQEKEDLIALVSDDGVKQYILRSVK